MFYRQSIQFKSKQLQQDDKRGKVVTTQGAVFSRFRSDFRSYFHSIHKCSKRLSSKTKAIGS